MATGRTSGLRIAGIASAVPEGVRTREDLAAVFGDAEAQKISDAVGVRSRFVTEGALCTSDLCQAAATRLLDELEWDRNSIDLLIFVSQTPDYILPATSCSLQARLGLPKTTAALDINLGCSGYVYGLWTIATMMMAGSFRRALLLVGDTISRIAAPEDRAVAPLFGDAGTATAIERDDAGGAWTFELGTDGRGERNLIVPAGGFRQPRGGETSRRSERESGNIRSDEDLFMDGAEIFNFTLREVRPLITAILASASQTLDDVDHIVMHQANRFMLQHLAKRLKLPEEKVVLALDAYGNTSSASIPLALTTSLAHRLRHESRRMLLVGFGVGYSWAAVSLALGPMAMPPLIQVAEAAAGAHLAAAPAVAGAGA